MLTKICMLLLALAGVLASPALLVHAQATVVPCFTFTDKDGKPIGDENCNQAANDIKIGFHSKCKIEFSDSGGAIVDTVECEKGENDFHAKWNATGFITAFNMTKFGEDEREFHFPPTADIRDFHVKHTTDFIVQWTLNGKDIGTAIPNREARDLEFRVRAF